MKRRACWILALLLGVQLPFLYSVLQSYRARNYLDRLAGERRAAEPPFQDLRGGIHVHSAAGGHSLGTYPEIFKAAQQAGYRYLFITEHPRQPQIYQQLSSADLVVVYGEERDYDTTARGLFSPRGEVSFLSHYKPGPVPESFTGIELFNIHQNFQRLDGWFNRFNYVYHQLILPGSFFVTRWEIDSARLLLWDRELLRRPLTGIAGNDAHQNVGLILQTTSGGKIFSVMVDPYVESFGFVSTHVVLAREEVFNQDSLLAALKSGAAYIAFECLGDATGFSFHGLASDGAFPLGSRVSVGTPLVVQSPLPVRMVVHRNGKVFQELEGRRMEWRATERGAYRVELYFIDPPGPLKEKPWILTNPIFVN
ncbi:MAG: hypothetical protein HY645_10620 [Acidobacteria bacterium]|nr:hypothetical protein [Acidobacteriota bacterium]